MFQKDGYGYTLYMRSGGFLRLLLLHSITVYRGFLQKILDQVSVFSTYVSLSNDFCSPYL